MGSLLTVSIGLGLMAAPLGIAVTVGTNCRVHLFIQCPDLGLHRAAVRGVRPSVRQEDRGLVEPPTSGATAPSSSQEAAGPSPHRVFGPNRPPRLPSMPWPTRPH